MINRGYPEKTDITLNHSSNTCTWPIFCRLEIAQSGGGWFFWEGASLVIPPSFRNEARFAYFCKAALKAIQDRFRPDVLKDI